MAKSPNEIGIHELYDNNPEEADLKLWGRKSKPDRRGFLKKMGLAAMATALGADIVFAENFPSGLIPALFTNDDRLFELFAKDTSLVVLNDRPWNVETPPHLLDDKITPASKFFMRNNGKIPDIKNADNWSLQIDGESAEKEISLSLADLKSKFKAYTYQLTIECGGNGRAEFNPPAKGNQWTTGAVACAEWTGVRLKDVLEHCGIKQDAVYIAYYGVDTHLSGDPNKVVISRGIPMKKAYEDDVLLAYQMNGEDIPLAHGFPLRLVVGGWPGSASGKWINRLSIRNIIHDGPKMTGTSYRVPCKPVAPGSEVAEEDMCIIEAMPVKSLITYPKSGALIQEGKELNIRGHAWVGDASIKKVHYSIDFGQTWEECELEDAANRNAWQHFVSSISFPKKGYYEVWAKATDSNGISQPMLVPGWNPKGYLNNACHRIAVKVI